MHNDYFPYVLQEILREDQIELTWSVIDDALARCWICNKFIMSVHDTSMGFIVCMGCIRVIPKSCRFVKYLS